MFGGFFLGGGGRGGVGIRKKKSKTFSLIVNTLYMHGHNMASLGA